MGLKYLRPVSPYFDGGGGGLQAQLNIEVMELSLKTSDLSDL